MEKSKTLEGRLESLRKAREDFSKIVIAATAFEVMAAEICSILSRIDPNNRDKDLKEMQILDKLLIEGLVFKPTSVIADYIRRKSPELKHLNNYQLGILLSKGGFKSSTKSKKRGYYVTYKEL